MAKVIDREGDIVLAEVNGGFHVFLAADNDRQVRSIIPADSPRDGGCWCADWTDGGIRYVSNPRTRQTARKWYRILTREAREYAA